MCLVAVRVIVVFGNVVDVADIGNIWFFYCNNCLCDYVLFFCHCIWLLLMFYFACLSDVLDFKFW